MSPGNKGPAGRSPPRAAIAHAAFLLLVFAAELALFRLGTARQYSWLPARRFDQVQYLRQAYDGYAQVGARGFGRAAAAALGQSSPQGALHAVLAMGAFAIAGPSRSSALAVNLAAFLALQAALFMAARRVSGSWAIAWASVGLLAALAQPWSGDPGSATDFRLDWMAACAFGVALALALMTGGFRSTRWSVAFGGAAGMVLLLRFLSGAFLAAVYAGLAGWILLGPDRRRRLGRLLLSGACAAALSAWAFWRSRHMIYTYYWLGHFAGAERAVRDSHLGLLRGIFWLAGQALEQFGWSALVLAAGGAGILRACRRPDPPAPAAAAPPSAGPWVIPAIFAGAPSLVLLFQPEKASQVVSIILPGCVGLVIAAWSALAKRSTFRGIGLAAAVALAGGAVVFPVRVLSGTLTPGEVGDYRRANAVADFIFFRSEEAGLTAPHVAVTGLCDTLGGPVFEIAAFERHGRRMPFVAELPAGLFAVEDQAITDALARSDFVCLLTRSRQKFPIERQFAAQLEANRQWCVTHLHHDGDVATGPWAVSIFERPDLDRPAAGVDLGRMEAAALAGADPAVVPLPPPAQVRSTGPLLWSVRADLHYRVAGVYSPWRLEAPDLPPGLRLDPATGELSGRFAHEGAYLLHLRATNAAGAGEGTLAFEVVEPEFTGRATAPPKCADGEPIALRYRAFDAGGRLDFIDVTDLTRIKVLARVPASPGDRTTWAGTLHTRLSGPGTHRILVRFVRYDASAPEPYTYRDAECEVRVGPGGS